MPSNSQTVTQLKSKYRTKANSFIRKAEKHLGSDDDVAKICAFYAAYHAMHYALLCDPLFTLSNSDFEKQMKGLKGMHKECNNPTHHDGRPGSRGIGLNQVVTYLYKDYRLDYLSLHKTSVDVRYVVDYDYTVIDVARDAYDVANKIVSDALSGKICWEMKP